MDEGSGRDVRQSTQRAAAGSAPPCRARAGRAAASTPCLPVVDDPTEETPARRRRQSPPARPPATRRRGAHHQHHVGTVPRARPSPSRLRSGASPNQTTPGRSQLPPAGAVRRPASREPRADRSAGGSGTARSQRSARMSPCRRMVPALPARWCRSSTFCVTMDSTPGCRCWKSASAVMAWQVGVGPSRTPACARHTSPRRCGSARKP